MDDKDYDLAIPDRPTRPDMKLYVRALRNEWPIPEKVKQRILQVACSMIEPSEEDELPPQSEVVTPAIPAVVDADGNEISPAVPAVFKDNTAFRSELTTRNARVKLNAMRVLAQFGRLNAEQGKLDLARARYEQDYPMTVATDGDGVQTDVTQLTDEQLRVIIEQRGSRRV